MILESLFRKCRGTAGLLVGALAMILVGVVIWKGLEVAYHFYDLRNQVAYLLRSADLESDMELRKNALVSVKRSGISCSEQDIVVRRIEDRIELEIPYVHEIAVAVLGRRVKIFSLPVTVTAERSSSRG